MSFLSITSTCCMLCSHPFLSTKSHCHITIFSKMPLPCRAAQPHWDTTIFSVVLGPFEGKER